MRYQALKVLSFIGALAVSIAYPCVTMAVDGVILIDQNRAMAGNVTPGDTPGFPVEINIPGSYRLSGNLTVGTGASAGIKINSGNVTIDLNGFTIIGAGTVNAPDVGIDGSVAGVTVINGNIFNASHRGILLGGFAKVENLHVTSTVELEGIVVGDHSIVHGNIAYGNGGWGIVAGRHSLITGNTANHNGFDGIYAFEGSVLKDNVANDNGGARRLGSGFGIAAVGDATVTGNTTSFNGQNSGMEIGPNSTISGNTATHNLIFGIVATCPSSIVGNTATINTRAAGCVLDHNAP